MARFYLEIGNVHRLAHDNARAEMRGWEIGLTMSGTAAYCDAELKKPDNHTNIRVDVGAGSAGGHSGRMEPGCIANVTWDYERECYRLHTTVYNVFKMNESESYIGTFNTLKAAYQLVAEIGMTVDEVTAAIRWDEFNRRTITSHGIKYVIAEVNLHGDL